LSYIGRNIKAESANEAFLKLFNTLQTVGITSSPRGHKIKELIDVSLIISNPRNRIITCPERHFDLGYAFGELSWYLSKRNDLDTMQYYSKFMKDMSDDGKTLNSAYGYRIFGLHEKIGFNQFKNVIQILKQDKDSRQAVIHLHTPNNEKTKDEVCTMSLQFIVRENKLHMITNMRSNDLVLGFAYDVFAFTMLQEIIANELGLDIGEYCHNVGSMHYYEDNYYHDEKVINFRQNFDFGEMKPFAWKLKDFDKMLEFEEYIRTKVYNYKSCNAYNWAETTIQNLLNNNTDNELMIMYQSAFIVKMLRKQRNFRTLNNVLNAVRQQNEKLADILLLGCKCFARKAKKIIVEGVDGVGKSTYVESLRRANPTYAVVHYAKPTEKFKYYSEYAFNLYNDYSQIFDRFFISERVYAGKENSRLTFKEYHDLISRIKDYPLYNSDLIEFIFIVARNDEQLKVIKNRLKQEDKMLESRIEELNASYIEEAKRLRYIGIANVKIIDIYGREVE
jgi:thymidylate synthase